MVIKTIGHSNKKIEELISKLKENEINTVVDVRSTPYSQWAPQFNKKNLSNNLSQFGITYLYRGKNLGGLKANIDFEETILEVTKLSKKSKLVLMCSEKDYKKCHRFLVLTPAIERLSVKVEQIIWDSDTPKTISMF